MAINTADTSTFKAKLPEFYARWKNEFGTTAWSIMEKYTGKLG